MPWQNDGTFLRVTNNTSEEQGDRLWQQDLSASVKIIASRHDVHDHDLASGIAACMNLDGYNAMRANLDMGGFKVVNTTPGAGNNEMATYGQTAGELLFDDGTRILTLNDRYGVEIDSVSIPSGTGGGGEGSVSEITTDGTLNITPDPLTTIGTIGMKYLAAGQTFSGGISSIVIDDYGRVTQVTPGAFANTNLSNNQGAINTTIYSSTGTGTVILEATEERSGVMTAAQVQLLNSIQSGGGMIPPIELNGINETPQADLVSVIQDWTVRSIDGVSGGSWQDLLNITGSGLVNFLAIAQGAITTSGVIDFRLLIDGVVVYALDGAFTQSGGTPNDSGICLIGEVDASKIELMAFQQIKFNQVIQLQCRSNQDNSSSMEAYIRWQRYT